jgi:hypothetical protein
MKSSRHQRVAASATATQIAEGANITVNCIVVDGTSNGRVTILTADGVTTIMTISILANTTATVDCEWMADQGVAVTTPAGVNCTVFHGQPGS